MTTFRRFRAAENLLLYGYPLDGYTLLRDLRDRALLYGAMATGMTYFGYASGLDRDARPGSPTTEEAMNLIRKQKVAEERRILRVTLGSGSGFAASIRAELDAWFKLFDMEMHGSTLTQAYEMEAWAKGESDPTLPKPRQDSTAIYLNRSHEISWMLLRTLPYLQADAGGFGSDWAKKWRILDDSFRAAVKSLTEQLGLPIGEAIETLVDEKFNFSPRFLSYFPPRFCRRTGETNARRQGDRQDPRREGPQ